MLMPVLMHTLMRHDSASARGLTLIELLVGLSLLALMLRLSVPGFSALLQNQAIRSTAESLLEGLQAARSEALRRNRTVSFQRTGTGWSIGCETVDTAAGCQSQLNSRNPREGGSGAVVTQDLVATANAAPGAAFSGTLTFNGLGRVTSATLGAGQLAVFRVTHATAGACAADGGPMRCLNVVVGAAGQLRLCDPGVPAGASRAC
jgi:type IV fimbrial biogenesis protein FimT